MPPRAESPPPQPLPCPPFYTIPNLTNFRDVALSPLTTPDGSSLRPGLLFRSADVTQLDLAGWTALRDLGIGHVFDLRSKPEVDKGWGESSSTSSSTTGVASTSSPTPTATSATTTTTTTQPSSHAHPTEPPWLHAMTQAGITRTWTPVFAAQDYSPERLAVRYAAYMDPSPTTGFVRAYRDILQHAGPAFAPILRHLATLGTSTTTTTTATPTPDAPAQAQAQTPQAGGSSSSSGSGALIHCTAGKDRTGIFVALVLDLLRVPRDAIADEYALSALRLRNMRHDAMVARVRQMMREMGGGGSSNSNSTGDATSGAQRRGSAGVEADAEAEREGDVDADAEADAEAQAQAQAEAATLRMLGSRREAILGCLTMLDAEFGGAEGYVRAWCGLEGWEVEGVKKGLVCVR